MPRPPEVRHVVNSVAYTSDADTVRICLPEGGQLHSILIRASMTNGATSCRNVSMLDVVDDVRVVINGDTQRFAMRPREIEKMVETLLGQPLEMVQTEAAGAVQSVMLPVMFGRKLYDAEMFLPLKTGDFSMLEIDYSPAISATVGFATGTFTLDVILIITPSDEPLSYRGTLVTRRIKEMTTVASGEEPTDINRVRPMRNIMVYCYENNLEDGTNVTQVSLEANDRSKILQKLDWPEFLSLSTHLFGDRLIRHEAQLLAKDADVFDCRIGRLITWSLEKNFATEIGTDTTLQYHISSNTGDRVTLSGSVTTETTTTTPVAADSTNRALRLITFGRAPSYFGVFPFCFDDTPEGYLNTQQYENLKLYCVQGNAGATLSIITQELWSL